jgi:lysophospholipase L1-like esterase
MAWNDPSLPPRSRVSRLAAMAPVLKAPVLLAQAAWVVARVPRLPEAAGARAGRIGAGPPLRLLVVGDSSAAGVGVADQSEALACRTAAALAPGFDVTWRLIARSGATTAGALARIEAEAAEPYDVALTALGVNDVKNGVRLAAWLERTDALHAALRERFGVGLIVASGLPPVADFPALPGALRRFLGDRAIRFDDALRRRLAGRPGIVHLPSEIALHPGNMSPDGFHPGGSVYAAWAERAADVIRAVSRHGGLGR